MQLPALTDHQRHGEAARVIHEHLWANYLADPPVKLFIASTVAMCQHDLLRFSGNLHRFWASRGFRVRCHTVATKDGFDVWLEPEKAKKSQTRIDGTGDPEVSSPPHPSTRGEP